MKEEKQEENRKRKILVEFEVDDEKIHVTERYFSNYIKRFGLSLDDMDVDFLSTGKVVTPCESVDSGPLDTLP